MVVGFASRCSIERHIEIAQNAGAKGAIVITSTQWLYCRIKSEDNSDHNLTIPAVCINKEDADLYFNHSSYSSGIIADFSSNTYNVFDDFQNGAMIFLQVFAMSCHLFSLVLCTIRMIQFAKKREKKHYYTTVVLIFMFLGNNRISLLSTTFFVRLTSLFTQLFLFLNYEANSLLFACWVDPYNYHGVINTWPTTFIFISLSFAFEGISFILLSITLSGTILKIYGRDKLMFIPLVIGVCLIVFLVGSNLAYIILVIEWCPCELNISFINSIIMALMTVYFYVGGISLMIIFKSISSKNESGNQKEKNRAYFRLAFWIVVIAIAASIIVVAFPLNASGLSVKPSFLVTLVFLSSMVETVGVFAVFFMFPFNKNQDKLTSRTETSANSNQTSMNTHSIAKESN